MNTALFYGIVLALANIVLALVGFFLGFQTDKLAEGQWFNWLSLVAMVGITWLGIRAVREEAADKSLSYGRGVLAGFLISVCSGVTGAVYTFIHFRFINPNYADYYLDFVHQKWAEKGMGDAQMEAAEKGIRFMMSPGIMSVIGLFLAIIFGLAATLILAAILKRTPGRAPIPPSLA
jgi:hypothetical protein